MFLRPLLLKRLSAAKSSLLPPALRHRLPTSFQFAPDPDSIHSSVAGFVKDLSSFLTYGDGSSDMFAQVTHGLPFLEKFVGKPSGGARPLSGAGLKLWSSKRSFHASAFSLEKRVGIIASRGYIWIRVKSNVPGAVSLPVKVSVEDCEDIYDFAKATKKELPNKLGHVDVDDISIDFSSSFRKELLIDVVSTSSEKTEG
jgi:hypothetical protein